MKRRHETLRHWSGKIAVVGIAKSQKVRDEVICRAVHPGTLQSISGLSIDGAVGAEVLRVLKPPDIEAAVKAIETQTGRTLAAQRQLELSLQQARYEAAHARRQYDAVDPANRIECPHCVELGSRTLVVQTVGLGGTLVSKR